MVRTRPRRLLRLGLFDADPRLPPSYWQELAPSSERVEVEVGSGDGGFLLSAAAAAPSTLFVGFENRPARAAKLRESVAGSADHDPFSNVRILELDARWVVSTVLATDSVDAFHIYFPDPWWKKRHHKRRLFTADFCHGLRRSMTDRASVYLMTDVRAQFDDISRQLEQTGLLAKHWERSSETQAMGSYERKYRRQGRRIFQSRFVKKPGA